MAEWLKWSILRGRVVKPVYTTISCPLPYYFSTHMWILVEIRSCFIEIFSHLVCVYTFLPIWDVPILKIDILASLALTARSVGFQRNTNKGIPGFPRQSFCIYGLFGLFCHFLLDILRWNVDTMEKYNNFTPLTYIGCRRYCTSSDKCWCRQKNTGKCQRTRGLQDWVVWSQNSCWPINKLKSLYEK